MKMIVGFSFWMVYLSVTGVNRELKRSSYMHHHGVYEMRDKMAKFSS